MTINLTDPANHPANSPLTAKRIERVIEALQRSIQYQNGGDMAYVIADAIKGLEELLVSKEAASEPVPDEELDQMIWRLERDGMTPKLLSLMRELRECRKAKPVVLEALPCPVFLEPGLKFGKGVRTQCMLDALNRRAEYHAELDAMTPEQRAEHDTGIAGFKSMLLGNGEQHQNPLVKG